MSSWPSHSTRHTISVPSTWLYHFNQCCLAPGLHHYVKTLLQCSTTKSTSCRLEDLPNTYRRAQNFEKKIVKRLSENGIALTQTNRGVATIVDYLKDSSLQLCDDHRFINQITSCNIFWYSTLTGTLTARPQNKSFNNKPLWQIPAYQSNVLEKKVCICISSHSLPPRT